MIATTAKAAAAETKIYLSNHPNLMKEDFQNNKEFKTYAVQKVGKTGYTALYALPDEGGVWRTWAHVNPKIIGGDMEKMLAKKFPKFWQVFAGVKGGKESRGYYRWPDADGQVRDKFMVCTPLEGTPFIIAATTYLEEFTLPLQRMEVQALKQTTKTRNIVFAILGATILLIGIIVSLYGHALTGKIKSLTDVADRISVGELDAEIDVKSKDEIGELGEAISRMQDSIRLSIERLRRRR
jgi:methyl-accepting chemotaxis protein